VTRDEYAQLKHIVAGALSRPGADRSAYLSAQCGPDGPTRTEVESLLAAADRAAPLYEEPTLLIQGARVTLEALDDVEAAAVPFAPPPARPQATPLRHDPFEGTERYSVRRQVGAGGMGIVYEVEDLARGQVVALKTLQRRSGHDIYQLKREFRHLADVAHPNLVSLYDLVIDDRQCFFTMEFVDGMSLVEYARQSSSGSSAADRMRRVFPQLVEGVQELHRRGMQHGDIKPSNVLVTRTGRVVILDFGLTAGALRDLPGHEFAGTPAYLSPEQCAGGVVSNASDWYAVGATLYHALTGRLPLDGPVQELIERKMSEGPLCVTALAPDTPHDLSEVCMSMLNRDPGARMSGREALDRLSVAYRETSAGGGESSEAVFVGRQAPLNALSTAFANVQARRSASVFVHGPSGIGKSALVQHFIERRLRGQSVLVLRSRCHEHETIPYKALDGIVDSLARHLSALPPMELAHVMPRDVQALARLFPVMRAVAVEPARDIDTETDPILLHRQAFTAFRDLLGLLTARQPLVIDIDDFHWADTDSVRWLTELLRPPSPPSVLTLVSFRSEELDAKPFLRSLIERIDIGERLSLSLTPMSNDEVTQLIDTLFPLHGVSEATQRVEIVRDSGGNPFLVEALARHVALGVRDRGGATLEEMLTQRLELLPDESRAFLEALAVCGRPVLPARLFEACGFRGDERPLVARLRAEHLVRNSRSAERVEMYHDRIRETLAARVSPDSTRRIHELLAQVLVAHGDDDPEALFDHYRAAGNPTLAATQAAAAAAKASGVLAFDLAATFYRHALHLHPDAGERAAWSTGLARALENAGRPVEAADAYLDAAAQVPDADRLEWRRKAAELLLIGGQIDRGLAAIDVVLRTVGVRLASGPHAALASLALRRLLLRLRGIEFRARPDAPITQGDLLRIDACWSITVGMAMVDPLRAADVNVRQLLWALRVGDPYRVARGLAIEAGFSTIIPVGAGRQRVETLRRQATALAPHAGRHYVSALSSVWAGIGAFVSGRWKESADLCGRALTTLRDHCTGVTWELNLAQNFFLFSLVLLGQLRQASSHLPGLLRSAREHGNVYLELELGTRMSLVYVAADEPDEAERLANEGMARWSQRGFQRPHYHHLLTLIQTRLYCGRPAEAWELVERHRDALRQNHFRRVQHTRIETANCRARCALARAAQGTEAPQMRAIVEREAQRILREGMPWANPYVRLLRATVAYQKGNAGAAVDGLALAIEGFEASDMQLHAAVCRWRLSGLVDGARARALRAEADIYMARQEIRNPAAMARLFAPGFPD